MLLLIDLGPNLGLGPNLTLWFRSLNNIYVLKEYLHKFGIKVLFCNLVYHNKLLRQIISDYVRTHKFVGKIGALGICFSTKRKQIVIKLSKMCWLLGKKFQLSLENKILLLFHFHFYFYFYIWIYVLDKFTPHFKRYMDRFCFIYLNFPLAEFYLN